MISNLTLKEKKPIRLSKGVSGVVCQLEVMKGEILVGTGWIIWDMDYGGYRPTVINNLGEPLRERIEYDYKTISNRLAFISWSIH